MRARGLAKGAVPAFIIITFFFFLSAPAGAHDAGRSIVRIRADIDGWSAIRAVCTLLGCQVTRALDALPDETGPSSLFLVEGLPEVTPSVELQLSSQGVEAVEPDLLAKVAYEEEEAWGSNQATAGVLDELWDRTAVTYYGGSAWRSYVDQLPAEIVRVRETHCGLRATGGTTVAVIDTGIDPHHPTLQPALVAGYDFTRNVHGGNEKTDVDQATAGVLDGIYNVNAATAAALDQATAGVLDDGRYSSFGHGTQVAGIVRLVAPTARIMPLKAFRADGTGYTSDIIRAIRYAVQNGARVLNMSFSRATPSAEVARALDDAAAAGVVAIASAGNEGDGSLRYPAAHASVIGVASTTNTDARSVFSSYGPDLVWVAAPGEGVISTYPWGTFAAAWGTSFSTPFVTGAAALLLGLQEGATPEDVAAAISHAVPLTSELGHGRLDLHEAVAYARTLWPDAPANEVPATCDLAAADWSEGS